MVFAMVDKARSPLLVRHSVARTAAVAQDKLCILAELVECQARSEIKCIALLRPDLSHLVPNTQFH